MKKENLVLSTLLFSACFVAVLLLVAHEFAAGSISARGLAVAIIVLFVVCLLFLFLPHGRFRTTSVESSMRVPSGAPVDTSTREKRLRTIRKLRIAVVFLAVALMTGLLQHAPPWALMVGAGINLCMMAVVIRALVRLQKSLH